MNHPKRNLKLRGVVLTACASVLWTMAGCGGDTQGSETTPDGGNTADVSIPDSSKQPMPDASSAGDGGPTSLDAANVSDSLSPDSSSAVDSSSADSSSAVDSSSAGDSTSPADSGPDAAVAVGNDAAPEAAVPLARLDLCPTLDTDWATSPTDYSTRSVTWGHDITGPMGFAGNLTNDCRANGIVATLKLADGGPNDPAIATYLDQLNAFALHFFGCGPSSDAGALSFSGLIPMSASGHTFTIADLTVLTSLFVNSTNEQASLNWAGLFATNGIAPSPEPLTVDQIDQIQTTLTALAAAYPGVNPNTTRLTFSTCETDAGTDASGD